MNLTRTYSINLNTYFSLSKQNKFKEKHNQTTDTKLDSSFIPRNIKQEEWEKKGEEIPYPHQFINKINKIQKRKQSKTKKNLDQLTKKYKSYDLNLTNPDNTSHNNSNQTNLIIKSKPISYIPQFNNSLIKQKAMNPASSRSQESQTSQEQFTQIEQKYNEYYFQNRQSPRLHQQLSQPSPRKSQDLHLCLSKLNHTNDNVNQQQQTSNHNSSLQQQQSNNNISPSTTYTTCLSSSQRSRHYSMRSKMFSPYQGYKKQQQQQQQQQKKYLDQNENNDLEQSQNFKRLQTSPDCFEMGRQYPSIQNSNGTLKNYFQNPVLTQPLQTSEETDKDIHYSKENSQFKYYKEFINQLQKDKRDNFFESQKQYLNQSEFQLNLDKNAEKQNEYNIIKKKNTVIVPDNMTNDMKYMIQSKYLKEKDQVVFDSNHFLPCQYSPNVKKASRDQNHFSHNSSQQYQQQYNSDYLTEYYQQRWQEQSTFKEINNNSIQIQQENSVYYNENHLTSKHLPSKSYQNLKKQQYFINYQKRLRVSQVIDSHNHKNNNQACNSFQMMDSSSPKSVCKQKDLHNNNTSQQFIQRGQEQKQIENIIQNQKNGGKNTQRKKSNKCIISFNSNIKKKQNRH